MSKSLGNVYGLDTALDDFGPMVLRFFYLNAQYRSPLEFVRGKSLEEAREAYGRLSLPADRIAEILEREGRDRPGRDLPEEISARADALIERLDTTLADDFNTREVIALLFGWTRELLDQQDRLPSYSGDALEGLRAPYAWGEETLGLFVREPTGRAGAWAAIVPIAIAARARARARGDFAEADRIRDELRGAGIRLEDDASGTRWEFAGPS